MRDLHWAQQFALHNRNEMMDRVLTEVSDAVHGDGDASTRELELQRINCHHNFTQHEVHFGQRSMGDAQRRDRGAPRHVGDDSRVDGHAQLYRGRHGKSGASTPRHMAPAGAIRGRRRERCSRCAT